MLIQHSKTKFYLIKGIGFCANKKEATRFSPIEAFAYCIANPEAITDDP